jgi:hypothetical protein
MAGQAQRGSRGHGRSSRPGSSLPRRVAASAAGPGLASTKPSSGRTVEPMEASSAPATRSLYRLLQMKGMTPAEAASLTAFLCGLPTSDLHWSLKQVNQMLFLRQQQQTGRFGRTDGNPRRPH